MSTIVAPRTHVQLNRCHTQQISPALVKPSTVVAESRHILIQPEVIPMPAKLLRRFYEPIVLLVALTETFKKRRFKGGDQSGDSAGSAERTFHGFLNKVCQICDTEPGPKTTTAVALLDLPDGVEYRFASNQRNKSEIAAVEAFISNILTTLGEAQDEAVDNLSQELLRQSLQNCRVRVYVYARSLRRFSEQCINELSKDATSNQSELLANELYELRELAAFSMQNVDAAAFRRCEDLVRAIGRLYKSDTIEAIRLKAKEDEMDEKACWCELLHAIGRLHSYLRAVDGIISARKQWPKAFINPKVSFVPSSQPASNPMLQKSRLGGQCADEIIGRMTSEADEMEKYKGLAAETQMFGLDENIRKQALKSSFRPIIHAEVLVLNSLTQETGGTRPSRFFLRYSHIGCSKPTCRLCEYYFDAHPSDVRVRPGHRNLYPNWKMPDVYWKGGVQERQRIINKMLPKIRDDTFRTLSERRPEGKPHDSNTETSRPLGIEDLAASLNGLEFETSEASSPEYSPSELDVIKGYVFGNEETETIEEEDDGWSVQGDVTEDAPEAEVEGVGVVDDDDDEDGGVLLFRGR